MGFLDDHFRRMEGRIDAVLDAIENGEDPNPAIRKIHESAPWDTVKVGMAFLKDVQSGEEESDGQVGD